MTVPSGLLIAVLITAILFGGWGVVLVTRVVYRALGLVSSTGEPTMLGATAPHHLRCQRTGCHAENRDTAVFCRRCGSAMPGRRHVDVWPARHGGVVRSRNGQQGRSRL